MAHLNTAVEKSGLGESCIFPETSLFWTWFCNIPEAAPWDIPQYDAIPKPIPPSPPGTPTMTPAGEAVYTGTEIEQLSQSSLDRTKQTWQQYIDGLIASGKYKPFGDAGPTSGTILLLAAGGVVLLMLARR
jgi:hypothetical protein